MDCTNARNLNASYLQISPAMAARPNIRGKAARKIASRIGVTLNTLSLLWGHTLGQYIDTVRSLKPEPEPHPAWMRRKLKGIVDKRVDNDVDW